jgi:hypothetical protein
VNPAAGGGSVGDHGVIQVVVIPAYQEPLRKWLAMAGLCLFPIPNGHDVEGNPAFTDDDLPTYGIGKVVSP